MVFPSSLGLLQGGGKVRTDAAPKSFPTPSKLPHQPWTNLFLQVRPPTCQIVSSELLSEFPGGPNPFLAPASIYQFYN
jgi:hypothetical protein